MSEERSRVWLGEATSRMAGEVARRWHQILPSLLNTFDKLKKLGFTYYNGNVSVILPEKEEGHV